LLIKASHKEQPSVIRFLWPKDSVQMPFTLRMRPVYEVKCFTRPSIHAIFAADSVGLSSFKFSWLASKTHVLWNRIHNDGSRSSKVVDFSTNWKRVGLCDLLLVINSNLGQWSYLAQFQRYCWFSAKNSTPSLWTRLPMLGLRRAKTPRRPPGHNPLGQTPPLFRQGRTEPP